MPTRFETCLSLTLAWEGGFVDNAQDPGGATCHGITLASYQQWSRNPRLGAADIRDIPSATVTSIYETNYWKATLCDALPAGVDLMVFDESVNSGCGRSVRLLQEALGLPAAAIDGCPGPATTAAAAKADPATLIQSLASHQLAFYRALPNFGIFGAGWTSRLEKRHTVASSMVTYADA